MDSTTRIVNLEKQNIELIKLLESLEIMLSNGNSINPQSTIRGAIRHAIGLETMENINEKLKTK